MHDSQVMNCVFSSSVTVFSFKRKLFLHLSRYWLAVCSTVFLFLGLAGLFLLQLVLEQTRLRVTLLAQHLFLRLVCDDCNQEILMFSSGVPPFSANCMFTRFECRYLHHQKRQFRPQHIEESASVEKAESSLTAFLRIFSGYIPMQ